MTPDSHALRKAKVYEAALTLTAQGISPAAAVPANRSWRK